VAFVVMLAAVGVPLDQLLRRQRDDILGAMGIDDETLAEQQEIGDEVFAVLRELGGTEEARKRIRARLLEAASEYTPEQLTAIGFSTDQINQQIAMMTSPWFLGLLVYDPAPALARKTRRSPSGKTSTASARASRQAATPA
jgi:hypothetical protein